MTVATCRVVQKRRLVDDDSIKKPLVDEEKATPSFAIIPESSATVRRFHASSSRQGAAVSKQSRGRRKQIGRASRFETRPMSMHDDLAGSWFGRCVSDEKREKARSG